MRPRTLLLFTLVTFLLSAALSTSPFSPSTSSVLTPAKTSLSSRSVYVLATSREGTEVSCSGFMVGSHWVMTAAHCVVDFTLFTLTPGQTSADTQPFGMCYSTSAYAPSAYASDTERLDYALIDIQSCTTSYANPTGQRDVGRLTSWWPLASPSLTDSPVTFLGYPSTSSDSLGTLYASTARADRLICSERLAVLSLLCFHPWGILAHMPTTAGSSGGVVYASTPSGPAAVGIVNAYSAPDGEGLFRYLDQGVRDQVSSWMRNDS